MSDDSHEYDEEVFTTIGEIHELMILNDPLYQRGFAAGAASRDAEIAELVAALERLARLGNGAQYGNSDGNRIAQAALAKRRKDHE